VILLTIEILTSMQLGRLGGLVGICARSVCGRSVIRTPVGSSQIPKNWHMLLPWLTITI